MNQNNNVGKLTTFYRMIDTDRRDSFNKILIPKIQRDYAQGRANRGRLRKRFLNRLFSSIDTQNAGKCELDFVYGKSDGEKEFLPIDGQQRLTTLFLLHLYIAKRAGVEEEECLTKFSYETRDSSKQFCERLNEIPNEKFDGIKDYIENQWWYNSRWKNDPTIKSMIVMLGDIDEHYRNLQPDDFGGIWNRLKENITFWILALEDLDSSDDLYIKMNSRGKLLTDFEHFKAQIESYIPKDDKENLFSRKVDKDWTDLFWEYREKENDEDPQKYTNNGLDKMFLNIFRTYMIIESAKAYRKWDSDLQAMDVLELAEKVLKNDPSLLARLEKILDFFACKKPVEGFFTEVLTNTADEEMPDTQSDDDYRVYIPKEELGGNGVDYLKAAALDKDLSIRKVLMLEAFFEYATLDEEHKGDIKNKIRIIRNLVFNSDTRYANAPAMLKSVDAIIKDVNNIHQLDGFNILQIKQEEDKLAWISQNPNDEMLIKRLENHGVIVGNVSAYMYDGGCCVTMMGRHKELFHKGADYERIAKLMLTFGDFSYTYNAYKRYAGSEQKLWGDNIFIHANDKIHGVLSTLFASMTNLDDKSIDSRISDWKKSIETSREFTWEYYMVAYNLLQYTKTAQFNIHTTGGKYDYLMMNSTRLSGKHWNPYLYCIHHKYFENESNLGEYDGALVFRDLGFEVRASEKSYSITFVDGSKKEVPIPQSNDGVDEVDRIVFAKDVLPLVAPRKVDTERRKVGQNTYLCGAKEKRKSPGMRA